MGSFGEAGVARAIYGGRMEMREVAALATLGDTGEQMQDREVKAAARAVWALGDYHTFATSFVWELGLRLVAACDIGPGQRVLDVAAGRATWRSALLRPARR